ncbi:pentapeptide repeat-containing protein, partial [Kribbella solani]|uniref:hypothetical protein n=1 Tax=Kribbella solani TaxID=236067 RepID=UPI0029B6C0D8
MRGDGGARGRRRADPRGLWRQRHQRYERRHRHWYSADRVRADWFRADWFRADWFRADWFRADWFRADWFRADWFRA